MRAFDIREMSQRRVNSLTNQFSLISRTIRRRQRDLKHQVVNRSRIHTVLPRDLSMNSTRLIAKGTRITRTRVLNSHVIFTITNTLPRALSQNFPVVSFTPRISIFFMTRLFVRGLIRRIRLFHLASLLLYNRRALPHISTLLTITRQSMRHFNTTASRKGVPVNVRPTRRSTNRRRHTTRPTRYPESHRADHRDRTSEVNELGSISNRN